MHQQGGDHGATAAPAATQHTCCDGDGAAVCRLRVLGAERPLLPAGVFAVLSFLCRSCLAAAPHHFSNPLAEQLIALSRAMRRMSWHACFKASAYSRMFAESGVVFITL